MRVDQGGAGSALCLHAGMPAAGSARGSWWFSVAIPVAG